MTARLVQPHGDIPRAVSSGAQFRLTGRYIIMVGEQNL